LTEVISTDVLVIGGGAAGANTVLKAADQGARVVMVVKGLLGKSGCSIFASHLPYHDVTTAAKSQDRYRYSVRYYNHYLTDQEHVKRMGRWCQTKANGSPKSAHPAHLRRQKARATRRGRRSD
jgi:succinate dehydrogenase/fumarate reductase flavoprotein subunit